MNPIEQFIDRNKLSPNQHPSILNFAYNEPDLILSSQDRYSFNYQLQFIELEIPLNH